MPWQGSLLRTLRHTMLYARGQAAWANLVVVRRANTGAFASSSGGSLRCFGPDGVPNGISEQMARGLLSVFLGTKGSNERNEEQSGSEGRLHLSMHGG